MEPAEPRTGTHRATGRRIGKGTRAIERQKNRPCRRSRRVARGAQAKGLAVDIARSLEDVPHGAANEQALPGTPRVFMCRGHARPRRQ